jgi:hypothetical protein
MQHLDIADKVAANISRSHTSERSPFRAYAHSYTNDEDYHFLWGKGFLLNMPASWRVLRAGFNADAPGGGGSRRCWTIGAQRGAMAGTREGAQTFVVAMEVEEQA